MKSLTTIMMMMMKMMMRTTMTMKLELAFLDAVDEEHSAEKKK